MTDGSATRVPIRWEYLVGGYDIAGLIPANATIDYGRGTELEAWRVANMTARIEVPATLPLMPVVGPFPYPYYYAAEPFIETGYVEGYDDVYAGPPVLVCPSQPVVARVTLAGFTHDYGDVYVDGSRHARFTGVVQAVDHLLTVRDGRWLHVFDVTAAGTLADWDTLPAGGTGSGGRDSEETIDRVDWILSTQPAGPILDYEGGYNPWLTAIDAHTEASSLLTQLVDIATDVDGLLWQDRNGAVWFRLSDWWAYESPPTVELPARLIDMEQVDSAVERASIITRVVVDYGEPDPDTGLRETADAEDAAAAEYHGARTANYTSQLALYGDAVNHAFFLLQQSVEEWQVTDIPLRLLDATEDEWLSLLALDVGHKVTFPGPLPPGAPRAWSGNLRVLGITDTATKNDPWIVLHCCLAVPEGGT